MSKDINYSLFKLTTTRLDRSTKNIPFNFLIVFLACSGMKYLNILADLPISNPTTKINP